jgi:DNA polymerase III delta subunit
MLTIICGEDSISSRNYFFNLKASFQNKDYETVNIDSQQTLELNDETARTSSLFSQKRIYFTENLNKKLLKKLNIKSQKLIEKIIGSKVIQLFNWEGEATNRDLKLIKGIVVKEFKPGENIFKLQDACFPGNLKKFLAILESVSQMADESFIFIMLSRYSRNLILIKLGEKLPRLASWQYYKLDRQAKLWGLDRLINFYEGLQRIDVNTKTSRSPYSIKKSLDILACYYL